MGHATRMASPILRGQVSVERVSHENINREFRPFCKDGWRCPREWKDVSWTSAQPTIIAGCLCLVIDLVTSVRVMRKSGARLVGDHRA